MKGMTLNMLDYLFPRKEENSLCRDFKLRYKIIDFIRQITSYSDSMLPVISYIVEYQEYIYPRLKDIGESCNFEEYDSVGPYVGLRNCGATCYMNALLQQLYMISSFKDTILSISLPQKTLTGQLQDVFAHLHIKGEYKAFSPEGFTRAH